LFDEMRNEALGDSNAPEVSAQYQHWFWTFCWANLKITVNPMIAEALSRILYIDLLESCAHLVTGGILGFRLQWHERRLQWRHHW
jgi:hypothetical protein